MAKIAVRGNDYEPREVVERAKKASGWFAAIALFSVVNSVLVLLNAKVSFVIGLGATQVVDALLLGVRESAAGAVEAVCTLIAVAVNLVIIGLVMLIWWLSKRGNAIAYVIGMVLYLLDTAIFLLVQDWVGVGFHVFFLAMLWGGYGFVRAWNVAQQALAEAESPQQPQMDPA